MIESITVDDLCNEARMLRDASSCTILLLEGDTDSRLFGRFVDDRLVTILVAHGKETAASVVGRLEAEGFQGVLAILDADYQHLEGGGPDSQNVVLTDYHDVEIMLLCSGALGKLVGEYCSARKVRSFLDEVGSDDLVEALLASGRPMGLLRLINWRRRCNLDFEGVRMKRFVDRQSLQVVLPKMIRCVVNNSRHCNFTDADIAGWIDELMGADWDCKQLCCGHDVIQILAVGLRRALGSCTKAIADASNLESFLRASYDSVDLRRSQVFHKARTWARRNAPFRAFSI